LEDLTALADKLVPAALDALDLPDANIVATSFGGWFALRTGLVAPLRLGRMVILGWTAGAPVASLPLSLRMGTFPLVGDLVGRLPAGRKAVRAIFRSIGEGPVLDAGRIKVQAIDAYAALLRYTDTYRNERALGRLFLSARRGLDHSMVMTDEDRRRISSPILFVWGEDDPFGGPQIASAFAGGFANARLELRPGAGHAPWMGDPAPVATLVATHLNG
jgi:pimeloyl-ACP methyl ester carboxylesterase